MWPVSLVRYIIVRARFNAAGDCRSVYDFEATRRSAIPVRAGLLFMVVLPPVLAAGVFLRQPLLLSVVPLALWLALAVFYLAVPLPWFSVSRLRPVVPLRIAALCRTGFILLVFTSLAWIQYLTGVWAGVYFFLLWVLHWAELPTCCSLFF